MSIGAFILGIIADNAEQNSVQTTITTENPTHMPRLNGSALLNPLRPAFDMDIIILLDPGVAAVTTAYVKNENQLNTFDSPFPKV